jgi:hypothetical protein
MSSKTALVNLAINLRYNLCHTIMWKTGIGNPMRHGLVSINGSQWSIQENHI